MTISEDAAQTTDKRKRVQWLKKCNIRLLIASVVLLMALCAMLLVRIHDMNRTIAGMAVQIEELSGLAVEQRAQLEQLAEELAAREELIDTKDEGDLTVGDKAQTGDDGQIGDAEPIENEGDAIEVSSSEVSAAHKVYLTFDDGPGSNTQKILDILEEYGVKATFFVVGKEGDSAKESLKRIVEDGHTLGMHSWSHKYSEVYSSMESFAEDFARLQDYLYEVTGVKSVVYRFPGGSSNTVSHIEMSEFAQYLDSQGVRFFDWNIAAGDGSSVTLPAETILENCTATISRYGTSVILMHEKDTTVEALPKIIEQIQAMEDTVILPITEDTKLVQHIKWQEDEDSDQ